MRRFDGGNLLGFLRILKTLLFLKKKKKKKIALKWRKIRYSKGMWTKLGYIFDYSFFLIDVGVNPLYIFRKKIYKISLYDLSDLQLTFYDIQLTQKFIRYAQKKKKIVFIVKFRPLI
jgi:hypothetical protein